MKTLMLAIGLVMATVPMASQANAAGRHWCAYYSGTGGSKNCYFTSFQQCLADVHGRGGSCEPSPFDH